MNEPKLTRTVRYLQGSSPAKGFDGERPLPHGVLSDPTFVPRLSWKMTSKLPFDPGQLATSIEQAPDALFFIDTSLVGVHIDERIWTALLNRPGKLVLIPHVLDELGAWLAGHPTHPITTAIRAQHPGIEFFHPARLDGTQRSAAAYYLNLLGFRKRSYELQRIRFESEHGRPPDDRDWEKLKAETQQTVGERGFMLAKKGAGPRSSTYYTDEEVVYFAVHRGLTSGKETFILTTDEDLQEQFYKLIWLLDTHYRSMLIAKRYVRGFWRYRIRPMPMDRPGVRDVFVGDWNVLIEGSKTEAEDALPGDFAFVAVHCIVAGATLATMTFGAEREMAQVFHVKGVTGGLNTDRLGGRNCHLWLAPLDLPVELRRCHGIVEDKRLSLQRSPVQIPLLDIWQAVNTIERFSRLVEQSPVTTLLTRGSRH